MSSESKEYEESENYRDYNEHKKSSAILADTLTGDNKVSVDSLLIRRRQKLDSSNLNKTDLDVSNIQKTLAETYDSMNPFQKIAANVFGGSLGKRGADFNSAVESASALVSITDDNLKIRRALLSERPDLIKTDACMIIQHNLPGVMSSLNESLKTLDGMLPYSHANDPTSLMSSDEQELSMRKRELTGSLGPLIEQVQLLSPELSYFDNTLNLSVPPIPHAGPDVESRYSPNGYTRDSMDLLLDLRKNLRVLSDSVDQHLSDNYKQVDEVKRYLNERTENIGSTDLFNVSDIDNLGHQLRENLLKTMSPARIGEIIPPPQPSGTMKPR